MNSEKLITGIIGGGALGYSIGYNFFHSNIPLAILGIGIFALYFNLLFHISTISHY